LIDFTNIEANGAECDELVDRLRRHDASLWSDDTAVRESIENRLGWLDAAAFMDARAQRIGDFADRIIADGYRQAVLLGMGGSSLAPEVYASLFDDPRGLALTVADTTSPDHVEDITRQCERSATLFIVSSKSGTTAETSALEAHCFEWAGKHFDDPGRHFIAITDPGSPLETLAGERGYRDTFLNPADIGGRFSALSFFGLVPAALTGVDLGRLRQNLPSPTSDSALMSEACRLGLALGRLARQGRNKLTLCLSPALAPVAAWIEQLIDESTGKQGTGLVVVADEPRLEPQDYSTDRCFVTVELEGEPVDEAWIKEVADLGHPVARWQVSNLHEIGAELLKWESATAMAGRVLGINPFDEPDVNDSKAKTRALLKAGAAARGTRGQSPADLRALLDGARPGDYIALLAYLPPAGDYRRLLGEWRGRLTHETGLPCCVGFGPRYLHSSGQLHKGGPDQGLFVVITLVSETDVPIPGQRHGFRSLFNAQAMGDLQVLKDRGRRVVHLEVDGTDSLEQLIDSVR